MKQWEVMRLLEENPAKVYESDMHCGHTARMRVRNGYYQFEIFNGESLIGQYREAGAFNGNAGLYFDWHEVKQPVTWQEAIQAWVDGKKVVWEEDAERRVFDRNKSWAIPKYQSHLLDQDGDAVTVRMISGGKWYVED